MPWWNLLITVLAWAGLIRLAEQGAHWVRYTSLGTAWRWSVAAALAVCVMSASDFVCSAWPGQTADYGWCLASVLLLCPPMAVLGARRPGVQVWSLFILAPMIAVLSWPVWTVLLQQSDWRGLELETPTVLGFGFVLLLGTGNFLGTRFACSAVLFILGAGAMFGSSTGWSFATVSEKPAYRLAAVALLVAAVVTAQLPVGSRPRHAVNRLWDDFRQAFGMVWGLRMVERINALAVQEGWTIRMSLAGFPETDAGQLTSDEQQVTAACRWLFRRFVDEEWISQRLGRDS